MPATSVEERLSAVEKEIAKIKQQLATEKSPTSAHPWDKVFGAFANSEGFEEVKSIMLV